MNIFYTCYFTDNNIRLKNNTNKIVFKEGFTKIDTNKIAYNVVRDISLPKSLIEIGEYVFRNNRIEKLNLPENLTIIGEGAFRDNKITDVIIPKKLETIKPLTFKNNLIKNVELNDIITTIGYSAFQNNEIKELDLKNVEVLEPCAFNNNKIEKVIFEDRLKILGPGSLQDNKLKYIDLKNVENICMESLANNELEEIIIPDTVVKLEPSAFRENKIKNVKIGSGIDSIPSRCFYNNKIKYLEIPGNIKRLEMCAFLDNEIEVLKLNEGLEVIESRCFGENNLNSVVIPTSVKTIGKNVFDPIDVYYDNIKIEKELIKKYGTEYIIKLAQIKKVHQNFNFAAVRNIAIELIPTDNDSIKGLNSNIKAFEALYTELKDELIGKVNYPALFKLAYILGLFKGDKKAIESIVYLTNNFTRDDIVKFTNEIELTKFDKKFADVINNGIKECKEPIKLAYIIPHFYNNTDFVKKGILKQKENMIAKLNTLIKNQYREEYKIALEKIKKNKNKITLEDLDKFITNSLFDFSEENKELKEYSYLFNGNIKKEDTPKLENIMNLAKKVEDSKFKEFTGQYNEYTYKWLDNKDPLNLVLGYLVNCCSKLKGVGEDIMVQSMTNPNLRNLVIFRNNEVVAKTTAFYNNNYILCNNIEVSDKFMQTMKLSDRSNLLQAVLEGLIIQAKHLDVEEVRVGMLRNDLNRPIYELGIEIKHEDLLDNYRYLNYAGDANNPVLGQAIVYKK